jgi:hypothetical protein
MIFSAPDEVRSAFRRLTPETFALTRPTLTSASAQPLPLSTDADD